MKKIGVSINLFDGYEFLEMNLSFLREYVDHINIVYQNVSNTGTIKNKKVTSLVNYLKGKGLVDSLIEYIPTDNNSLQDKEINKRNIGLDCLLSEGCNYMLAADADELYLPALFEEALTTDFDVYFVKIRTYYKYPEVYYDEDPRFVIPFLQRINKDSSFSASNPRKYLLDATRILKYDTSTVLKGIVHHFSYIRTLDFYSKFHSGTNSKNAERHYRVLEEAYNRFSSIKEEATILRNWSHVEKVKINHTTTIANLLDNYEWNGEKGIYTKRSVQ